MHLKHWHFAMSGMVAMAENLYTQTDTGTTLHACTCLECAARKSSKITGNLFRASHSTDVPPIGAY
jgi:hypothetical protein